jgi:hypothetical protein
MPPDGPRLAFGITPHAPYSTSEAVYRRAVRLARQRGWPVLTSDPGRLQRIAPDLDVSLL